MQTALPAGVTRPPIFKMCLDPVKTGDGIWAKYGPCRKCEKCIEVRQNDWATRAKVEFAAKERTWYVTLTLDASSEKAEYDEVQKFLKRVRKDLGNESIRYLCVQERGSKGTKRRHWHLLVHCNGELTRRRLDAKWRAGFIKSRLARSSDVAYYISKYCGKDSGLIRPSIGYGGALLPSPGTGSILDEVFAHFPRARVSRIRTTGGDYKIAYAVAKNYRNRMRKKVALAEKQSFSAKARSAIYAASTEAD